MLHAIFVIWFNTLNNLIDHFENLMGSKFLLLSILSEASKNSKIGKRKRRSHQNVSMFRIVDVECKD